MKTLRKGSIFTNDTTPYKNDPTLIDFKPDTGFNGIRTTWQRVPYLLQSDQHIQEHPRCNGASDKSSFPSYYDNISNLTTYTEEIAATGQVKTKRFLP